MSQRRGRLTEYDFDAALEDLRDWYHVPSLLALMAFMFWVRARSWGNFVRDGQVIFSGNDPWYHLRQTTYTVQNWPQTMPFDAHTYFPYGTANSQFGTLFDQVVATAALVVGLGDPSQQTIAMTLLFAPAVIGTLVAVPVYFGGKRLGGRFGGVLGVVVLALSTGGFLGRGLVGFSDHHIAEVFLQMMAVVAFMTALGVAESEYPVWELVANREWDALRKSAGWAALAGIALALYLWTWPPGIILIGVLGIFFLLQITIDYVRGASPEPVAFVGAVGMGVAGLLMLVPFNTFQFTPVDFSLLQPFLAFSVAGGCTFMAYLSREFDQRGYDARTYPFAVFGTIVAITVVASLIVPDLINTIVKNADRVVGLGGGARASTIGEAQPLPRPLVTLFSNYGLAFVSAGVGVLLMLGAYLRRRDASSEWLLIVVWSIILLLATLTQQRFSYYLVLPIALANAYVVKLVLTYISPGEETESVQTFQVLAVLTVLIILVAPLAVGAPDRPTTAWERGGANAPSSGVVGWDSGLDWLGDSTPTPGTYGGEDNAMGLYGTNERTDDYDYAPGAYGVISWWDYGHWITSRSGRIPTANPFQQGATDAANFLLAPNETQAERVVGEMSENKSQPQYVMVDWKMVNEWPEANGKFFAPIVFYDKADLTQDDFYNRVLQIQGQRAQTAYYLRSQRYYESMVNRLWHFHGSAQQPTPVTANYDERVVRGQRFLTVPTGNQSRYRVFGNPLQSPQQSVQQARDFVEEDGSAQVGGIGPNPPEYVDALEHYRLVHNSNTSAIQRGSPYLRSLRGALTGLAGNTQQMSQQERAQTQGEIQSLLLPNGAAPPWVKVFERVDGATIEGTAPTNATVTARVEMNAPTNNETFTYTQRAETGEDGTFTMTVPYSTTGYDQWGPENGHTNVSTRATGDYQFTTGVQRADDGSIIRYTDSASVTEAQVIGEDDGTVQVELSEEVLREPTDDGSSADSGTDGNSTTEQSRIAGPERTVVTP